MAEYQGCDNCRYVNRTKDEFPCFECTHNALDHWKPMTNAGRIRNMTDEELAEFLEEFAWDNEPTKRETLKWLQAEVSEDGIQES